MQKLIPCEMVQLRDDLHKIIVGDLLQTNKNVVVHDPSRHGLSIECLAHENTLDGVIATIAFFIRDCEFSLDVVMLNGSMARISVRTYTSIEGLI